MNPDDQILENFPDPLVRVPGTKMPEVAPPASPEPSRDGGAAGKLRETATTAVGIGGGTSSAQEIETLIDGAVTDDDYATLI
jgi:hypothetical protein